MNSERGLSGVPKVDHYLEREGVSSTSGMELDLSSTQSIVKPEAPTHPRTGGLNPPTGRGCGDETLNSPTPAATRERQNAIFDGLYAAFSAKMEMLKPHPREVASPQRPPSARSCGGKSQKSPGGTGKGKGTCRSNMATAPSEFNFDSDFN